MKFLYSKLILPLLIIIACTGCKKESEKLKNEVVRNYAVIVHASYQDALLKAIELRRHIRQLVDTPLQKNLDAARQAYIEARVPYGQTEAYRFYGGPIDGDKGVEGFMNGWPLDEAYIDYVNDKADAGIINHPELYPVISKEVLKPLNESGSETNLSTGYHAIEFLLWGQDLSATSAGNRPYTDYVTGGTAANQQRRGQYLLAVAELLVDNLQYLVDQWQPGSKGNYYEQLTSAPADSCLHKIILGMGSLSGGELGGERIRVAYETQDQEDEHSCFSDQTHNDLAMSQKSILNVYTGTYTRTDGTVIKGAGIQDLIKAENTELNTAILNSLQQTETAIAGIQPPFDREIVDAAGRTRISAIIKLIDAQTQKLVEGAQSIHIPVKL